MAFCPTCGAQVQGAFCMRCGSPAAPNPPQHPPQGQEQQQQQFGQQPPPPYGQQQYGQQPPYGQPAPAAGMEENVASALSYLVGLITGILFLVLEPYNKSKTVRFHAFQSIFFNVGAIVIQIALTIVFSIFRSILPYGTWVLFSFISTIVSLGFMGIWILLMYKAYNRERFKLPIIGDLAEKQA